MCQDTLDRKAVLLAQVARTPPAFPRQLAGPGLRLSLPTRPPRVGVLSTQDEDIRSLRELITYGLKGLAAYTKHANALVQEDA